MSSKPIKKETEFAGRKLSLETGRLAPQANLSITARYGDTVILATAVANEAKEEIDYFPLRVDYEEKLYAGGFIKTSRFVKREGRPSDEATITSRLIDHAIRPLFPSDFMESVQVIVTVLSVDDESDPEFLAMVAASAVLHASDIPWNGPMGTARIGKKDGQLTLNPNYSDIDDLDFNLIISFVGDRILAMEGDFNQVPEKALKEAIELGHEETKSIISLIKDFAAAVGKKKYEYESQALSKELLKDVSDLAGKRIEEMVKTPMDKLDMVDVKTALLEEVHKEFEGKYKKADMNRAVNEVEKSLVRKLILKDKKRPDGRKIDEIRSLDMAVGILPRTHGSGLFARGVTQSLTVATLGSGSLEQLIQNMYGEESKRYIHHYNAPPFSTGETAPIRGPGRRAIGHGALAEKALLPVIPDKEEFPYTIRLVSEILSQNGSSSMAATCGSTLSLMDAGVPIKAPVAGIAMGLMTDKDEKEFVVLTDIAGVEDFDGFMDFKLAGTREGMTAVQMDIKLAGVPKKVLFEAIDRSRKARLRVLDEMAKVIDKPRPELSEFAPRITVLKIDPKKIGEVIGPGGKIIKSIIETTGAEIDIEEDGTVLISSTEPEGAEEAKILIEQIVREFKAGEKLEGTVVKTTDFGAFVELIPGREGLVHISELAHRHVRDTSEVVKVGEKVKVEIVGVDDRGRINLSMKSLQPRPRGEVRQPSPRRPSGPSRRPRPARSPHQGGPRFRTPYYQRPAYRGR